MGAYILDRSLNILGVYVYKKKNRIQYKFQIKILVDYSICKLQRIKEKRNSIICLGFSYGKEIGEVPVEWLLFRKQEKVRNRAEGGGHCKHMQCAVGSGQWAVGSKILNLTTRHQLASI